MFVFRSSDRVDLLKDPGWRIRLAGCVCRRGPSCDTHTTRSGWRPVNPTACLCPDRTKETRETGWRIRSPSSEEVATCSAPSCVCVGSWGVCRTCRNLALCSCTACRWCVRESASSGHYCWQSVDHSHQTRTWMAFHLCLKHRKYIYICIFLFADQHNLTTVCLGNEIHMHIFIIYLSCSIIIIDWTVCSYVGQVQKIKAKTYITMLLRHLSGLLPNTHFKNARPIWRL